MLSGESDRGDFMKVLERPDIDPRARALFMPTAQDLAASANTRLSASDPRHQRFWLRRDSFAHQPERLPGPWHARQTFVRTGWRALLAADLLQKLLLLYRPYESSAAIPSLSMKSRSRISAIPWSRLLGTRCATDLAARFADRSRDRFRKLPSRKDRRLPMIGIVGEIFCR